MFFQITMPKHFIVIIYATPNKRSGYMYWIMTNMTFGTGHRIQRAMTGRGILARSVLQTLKSWRCALHSIVAPMLCWCKFLHKLLHNQITTCGLDGCAVLHHNHVRTGHKLIPHLHNLIEQSWLGKIYLTETDDEILKRPPVTLVAQY